MEMGVGEGLGIGSGGVPPSGFRVFTRAGFISGVFLITRGKPGAGGLENPLSGFRVFFGGNSKTLIFSGK